MQSIYCNIDHIFYIFLYSLYRDFYIFLNCIYRVYEYIIQYYISRRITYMDIRVCVCV